MNTIDSRIEPTPNYTSCKKTILSSISVAIGSIAGTAAWYALMSQIIDEDDQSLAASFIRINTNLSSLLFSLVGATSGYFITKKLLASDKIKEPSSLV